MNQDKINSVIELLKKNSEKIGSILLQKSEQKTSESV